MKKKMSQILSSPYTYAVLIAIAAFVAAYGSNRINNKRNRIAKQTENIVETAKLTLEELKVAGNIINSSLKEAEQANSKLEKQKDKITEILNETSKSKDATLKSQENIIGMLTGGDAFPSVYYDENGFHIISYGKYGIPNLKLQIVHIPNYESCPIESISRYLNDSKADENVTLIYDNTYKKTFAGAIHTIKFSELGIDVDKNISHAFDFNFNSDFKRWTQRIRLIPVNNGWEVLDGLEEEISYKDDTGVVPKPRTIHFRASINFPYLQKIPNGIKLGRNASYYHLTIERDNKLKYHNLFNRSFDITGDNIVNRLDLRLFDVK